MEPRTYNYPCPDQAEAADAGVVQHHGIDAQQHVLAQLAAMHHRSVSHYHIVAQFHVSFSVQHTVVLYGAVCPNDDASIVAANYCSGPDVGIFPNLHITNNVSAFTDKDRGVNSGGLAVEAADHIPPVRPFLALPSLAHRILPNAATG